MKIGLVLSGGGARGIMHTGVLQAIEEAKLRISCMAGTSAGAITGALYSYGYAPREILDIIQSRNLLHFMRISRSRGGLISTNTQYTLLRQYIEKDNFSALRIPLTIAATDIGSGKAAYFETGPLVKAITASSAVPVLFAPVQIEGRYYVDGGITDNLPVEAIRDKVDFIIGAHSNPVYSAYERGNIRSMMERAMLLAINGNVEPQKRQVDLLIEPEEMGRFSVFAHKHAQQLFEIGYEATKTALKRVPGA